MPATDVVRISDLRLAVGLALDAFESEHGSEVELDRDHYWHLPIGDSFDLSREPASLTVGQLTDDLAEIQKMIATGDAHPSWHALALVAGLLRLVEGAATPTPR